VLYSSPLRGCWYAFAVQRNLEGEEVVVATAFNCAKVPTTFEWDPFGAGSTPWSAAQFNDGMITV